MTEKYANRLSMKSICLPVIVALTAISALAFAPGPVQAQSVVINGDFSGAMADWTVVIPAGYTNVPYAYGISPFKFSGETGTSQSFDAWVGAGSQVDLEQTLSLSGGIQYNFSADVAAYYPTYNVDGGTITLSIGGNQVGSISFGGNNTGGPLYGTLNGSYIPDQNGDELLILNFSRNYIADSSTPTDYITDISLAPVPEPPSIVVLGLGILALALRRASLATHL